MLGTLLFIDYVLSSGYYIVLGSENPENFSISLKEDKNSIAEKNLANFYH